MAQGLTGSSAGSDPALGSAHAGGGSEPARPSGNGDGNVPVSPADASDLRALFHTLNNQLGVILTYAELVEAKAPDEALRARATQIVSAAVDALNTSKDIRAVVVK